jgi:hypothetical protein
MYQDSSPLADLWKPQDDAESAAEANPNGDDDNIEAVNDNNSSGLSDPPSILPSSPPAEGTG